MSISSSISRPGNSPVSPASPPPSTAVADAAARTLAALGRETDRPIVSLDVIVLPVESLASMTLLPVLGAPSAGPVEAAKRPAKPVSDDEEEDDEDEEDEDEDEEDEDLDDDEDEDEEDEDEEDDEDEDEDEDEFDDSEGGFDDDDDDEDDDEDFDDDE